MSDVFSWGTLSRDGEYKYGTAHHSGLFAGERDDRRFWRVQYGEHVFNAVVDDYGDLVAVA